MWTGNTRVTAEPRVATQLSGSALSAYVKPVLSGGSSHVTSVSKTRATSALCHSSHLQTDNSSPPMSPTKARHEPH